MVAAGWAQRAFSKTRLMVPTGKLTKLQAGGYPSRAAAEAACRSLKDAGQECLVTR